MKLPYKYRGAVLLASLTVVLPWAAWRFALGDTFGTWRECRRLCVQLAAMAPAPAPGNGSPPWYRVPNSCSRDCCSIPCGRPPTASACRLGAMSRIVTLARDGLAVHTAQLTLAGGYAPLLRVVGGARTHAAPVPPGVRSAAELRRPPDAVLAADPYVVYPAGCTQKIMP